jgi:predicted nucleotidyltransferase component of viral defense system
VIPKAEILALRGEWSLSEEVIEKDYVLGWLLAGITADPVLRDQWVFKGGTALRKCYCETYRFSEDLDFTVRPGGPEEPADLLPIFQRIFAWLEDACGMRMVVDETSFRRRKNRRGNATTEGRLAYRGPRQPPGLPKVKLDLTSDELLAEPAAERPLSHPYSDAPSVAANVRCYSITELLAEKLRALVERCRPRDLYDVIHLHRHPDLALAAPKVRDLLARKCAFANVAPPTLASIHASPFRADLEQEWDNMLAHQLPVLPPLAQFWNALDDLFRWLEGTGEVSRPAPRLTVPGIAVDPNWRPSPMMSSWRSGAPIEIIRFAGANRLKILLDYRAESGRRGSRVVEPYSLRRTNDGHLLLYVVNDHGESRSYRVDRIASAAATKETFTPRYLVEF